ncbi:MAG: RecX family transcriptional regulator [Clostridia bacterium]|nr:RecX family transcriptional regulator [Clostridia bacterium]
MPEITSIEPQKKDKNRCSVYIDGRFYCGLTLEAAVKFHLKAGMPVEKKLLDEIQLETDKNTALDKALTHISATRKTEKQVADFLAKKGYTQAVCDYVLEKLHYYNFIDDYAYCKAYVAECRGRGKKLIEADLIKRGAKKEAIEAVLSESEEDEEEAKAVAEKYLRGKEKSKENIYKAFKYLLSRGYGYDTAKSAVDGLGEDL